MLRTEFFTERRRMTKAQFDALISSRSDLTTERSNGFVEVYKGGLHAGRYVINQEVFWFETTETRQAFLAFQERFVGENGFRPAVLPEQAGISEQWPPPCRACGAPTVARKGKHGWFFGCSAFPLCKETRPLTPHPSCRFEPSDLRGFGWSLEARKAHRRTQVREALESGLVETIKKLEKGEL